MESSVHPSRCHQSVDHTTDDVAADSETERDPAPHLRLARCFPRPSLIACGQLAAHLSRVHDGWYPERQATAKGHQNRRHEVVWNVDRNNRAWRWTQRRG